MSAYLREYLYADVDKIRSLAGQLMEGVPEESRTTEKRVKQLSLGIKAVAGSANDWASEEYVNKSLADSLFATLEDILESEGWLQDISDVLMAAETDLTNLSDSYPPAQLVRITGPGVLFDARLVARVLSGLAAAGDGVAALIRSENQSGPKNSQGAGRKNHQKQQVTTPDADTLEAMILDFDPAALGLNAQFLRSIVKVSRGVFSPGVHLMLTPRGDDITITARLQEGRKYLETDPEILFSRYGTARQTWTLVGSIGAYSQSVSSSDLDQHSFMEGDTISRSKFAGYINKFMQLIGYQGLADMPQFPGFSIVPLAAYRTIVGPRLVEIEKQGEARV
ncbi:DUF6414 family protein [Nonomuraea africana]|uniref:Uncharacterized protein n=1 Tax=Nonomuraea africana TaxID=46171 RepID=A0ABR9KSC7_9ACTN|nr:hypothetical protein [Nonomuraea africana]MBE1564946.1 hypothetical protein [Nonomuraea africana]